MNDEMICVLVETLRQFTYRLMQEELGLTGYPF